MFKNQQQLGKKCFENIFSMKLLLKLRCKKSVNFFSQSNISAPKPWLLRAAVKLTSLSILGVCCLSYLIRKVEVSESVRVKQEVPFGTWVLSGNIPVSLAVTNYLTMEHSGAVAHLLDNILKT